MCRSRWAPLAGGLWHAKAGATVDVALWAAPNGRWLRDLSWHLYRLPRGAPLTGGLRNAKASTTINVAFWAAIDGGGACHRVLAGR